MEFKDLDHFKRRAEFFPNGRIVPRRIQRITQVSRRGKERTYKHRHAFTFGADTYVMQVAGLQFLLSDFDTGKSTFYGRGSHRDIRMQGNPYGKHGTLFVGPGVDQLSYINEQVALARSGQYSPADSVRFVRAV